jgi:hypothetical protein
MKRVEGDTVAIELSLLASVIFTPPGGAAAPNATGKFTLLPAATVVPAGNRMPPAAGWVTVTLAVALPTFGALAVIVADPAVTPVTGTGTLVAPIAKFTAAGTVATVVSLELRPTASPAGAGADRFRARFCVALPLIVRLCGEKLKVVAGGPPPVTWTCVLDMA